ncbi:MAG: BamA/TamA family outer membrane protein [Bacteroidetes bacterium]|nr:BamA/TamA family outer membrane protein [Bacteroidota bacterium]
MNTPLPIRLCLLLLLLTVLSGFRLSAQVNTAAQDSLRAVEEIRAEQDQLTEELKQLRQQLHALQSEEPGDARREGTEKIEQRIENIEVRLDALERSIDAISPGEVEQEDSWTDEWEDEWKDDEWQDDTGDDDGWSWWKQKEGEGEQFDIQDTFFKKYPGNFPWMFPLTTRLHETFFRYNRVEGVYIGITQAKRLYWHSKPWVVSSGSLGYGFANHTWRYSLGLAFPIYLEDQIIEVAGEGYSLTDSKDQWSFDRDENTLTAFVAREDFLDYFERRGFNLSAAWYYRGEDALNMRASVGYVHDTYANMNRATNWSIFGGDKEFRLNPRINDGNMNSMVFSAGATTLSDIDDRSSGWDLQVQFESAGGFAAGDFTFSQIILDVRRYQPLGEHLNLNLRGRGGMSDGLLPQQRVFELGGPGTLPGYRFKEFSGSNVALLSAEFIVRSSIVGNARGWAKNVLRNTNLILFTNTGSTNGAVPIATRDVTNGAIQSDFGDGLTFDDWRSDVGVAFGSSDGDFRIGAAWRLDRSDSPSFVLRFSRPF